MDEDTFGLPKKLMPYEHLLHEWVRFYSANGNSSFVGYHSGYDQDGNIILSPRIDSHYDVGQERIDVELVKRPAYLRPDSYSTAEVTTLSHVLQGIVQQRNHRNKD